MQRGREMQSAGRGHRAFYADRFASIVACGAAEPLHMTFDDFRHTLCYCPCGSGRAGFAFIGNKAYRAFQTGFSRARHEPAIGAASAARLVSLRYRPALSRTPRLELPHHYSGAVQPEGAISGAHRVACVHKCHDAAVAPSEVLALRPAINRRFGAAGIAHQAKLGGRRQSNAARASRPMTWASDLISSF